MAMLGGAGAAPPMDQQINARITNSSLAPRPAAPVPFQNQVAQGVFIDNVWGPINVLGIGRPSGPGASAVQVMKVPVDPLAVGASVEWFGMLSGGLTGTGHALTVVDRTPGSDPATPAAWGNGCMLVDPWYALQAGGAITRHINGPNADAGYMAWLTAPGNSFRRVTGFTTGSYPWLSVPAI
jgi:hypothetical protein